MSAPALSKRKNISGDAFARQEIWSGDTPLIELMFGLALASSKSLTIIASLIQHASDKGGKPTRSPILIDVGAVWMRYRTTSYCCRRIATCKSGEPSGRR